MLFVKDATFMQQLIMYSFFIGTPILLFLLVAYLGVKSSKQNRSSRKCGNCGEFLKKDEDICTNCEEITF